MVGVKEPISCIAAVDWACTDKDLSLYARQLVAVHTATASAGHLLEGVLADTTFEAHFVIDTSTGFHTLRRVHRLRTHVTFLRLRGLQSDKQKKQIRP